MTSPDRLTYLEAEGLRVIARRRMWVTNPSSYGRGFKPSRNPVPSTETLQDILVTRPPDAPYVRCHDLQSLAIAHLNACRGYLLKQDMDTVYIYEWEREQQTLRFLSSILRTTCLQGEQ